jgi:hypothetical protein
MPLIAFNHLGKEVSAMLLVTFTTAIHMLHNAFLIGPYRATVSTSCGVHDSSL